jgi:hypothetical protein
VPRNRRVARRILLSCAGTILRQECYSRTSAEAAAATLQCAHETPELDAEQSVSFRRLASMRLTTLAGASGCQAAPPKQGQPSPRSCLSSRQPRNVGDVDIGGRNEFGEALRASQTLQSSQPLGRRSVPRRSATADCREEQMRPRDRCRRDPPARRRRSALLHSGAGCRQRRRLLRLGARFRPPGASATTRWRGGAAGSLSQRHDRGRQLQRSGARAVVRTQKRRELADTVVTVLLVRGCSSGRLISPSLLSHVQY